MTPRAVLALIATLAISCSCGHTADDDAGSDSGSDTGVDAGHDVGRDASDVGAAGTDAGPLTPPVLIEAHPEVVCTPVAGLVYEAPTRTFAPGDVLLATDLQDQARFAGRAWEPAETEFTGTHTGGFSAPMVEPAWGAVTFTAAGVFEGSLGFADGSSPVDQLYVQIDPGEALAPGPRLPMDPRVPIAATPDLVPVSPRAARTPPVVFASSGVVVWLSWDNVIQSNCVHGGALRWAVRYDNRLAPTLQHQLLTGLSDGSIVLSTSPGQVMRFASDGSTAATRIGSHPMYRPEVASERCGLLVTAYDADTLEIIGYEWWRLDDLTTRAAFPSLAAGAYYADPSVLADCSVAGVRIDSALGVRVVATGPSGVSWMSDPMPGTSGAAYVFSPLYALADGGLVVLQTDDDVGAGPARVSVFDAGGGLRWTRAYGPTVGQTFVDRASLLTPDGVLYAATRSGTLTGGYTHRFVAIGIDASPAPFAWDGSGTNWARTGAPLPIGADAGVGDAGGGADGGFDAGG